MMGKPFLGALAAETVTANPGSQRMVQVLAAHLQIELWLPDGTGMGVGDSCTPSPHTHQPFRSGQAAKKTPSRKQVKTPPSHRSVRPNSSSVRVRLSRGVIYVCR